MIKKLTIVMVTLIVTISIVGWVVPSITELLPEVVVVSISVLLLLLPAIVFMAFIIYLLSEIFKY